MKVEHWKHEDVAEDGRLPMGGGAVEVGGRVRFSRRGGGCDIENCKCSEGHWVCISFPRTLDGVVEGVTIRFDSEVQVGKFIDDVMAAGRCAK